MEKELENVKRKQKKKLKAKENRKVVQKGAEIKNMRHFKNPAILLLCTHVI